MDGAEISVADAIERAVVSPDPAVRAAAIRYRTLEQERQDLESFFSLYGKAHADSSSAAPTQDVGIKSKALPNGKMAAEFIDRIRNLLVKRGEPLRASRLYEAFYEMYPDQKKVDSEAFRQRLTRYGAAIRHVEGAGYWPADMEVPPSGNGVSDGGA